MSMESASKQSAMSVSSQDDRRQSHRHNINVQIEVRERDSEVPLRMQTTDLSRGGCYIQVMMPMPVGTYLDCKFWLGDKAVEARGRVVTRHPQFGNGIIFLEFKGDGAKTLTNYLNTTPE
jgi:c-di-GMP-binding flagellar brake protein YcgR